MKPLMMPILLLIVSAASAAAAGGPGGPLFDPSAPPAAVAAAPAARRGLPVPTEKNVSNTADWTYAPGLDFSLLGSAVSTVGDLNGDGYSDAAVGAPNMRDLNSSRVGAVLIFYGSAAGLASAPDQIIYGPTSTGYYYKFGAAVSPAGDVNGDGFGDLLVGSPGYSLDGGVFVYLGSAGGLQSTYVWSWNIDYPGSDVGVLGSAVSTAGDVNGDGYDDILVGAPGAWFGARGRVALFLGSSEGPAATPAWDVTGNEIGNYLGTSLAAAGDVNGDGYDDVIVGEPGATGIYPPAWDTYYGLVSIYHGGPAGLSPVPDVQLYGTQYGSGFGSAVSGAGDMNGDGFADIGVGMPTWDSAWAIDGGRALVYPGSAAGVTTVPIWEEFGSLAYDKFGQSLAPGGDVNGDGLGDMLVGSADVSNGGAGSGFVATVTGSRIGAIFMSWYRYDTVSEGFGGAVGTAGDVDGDGFSDILVGSSAHSGTQTLEGMVQMFRGAGDPPSPSIGWSAHSALSASFYGWVLAPAGDVNGDGLDDVLASAPNAIVSGATAGLVVLFYGSVTTPTVSANWYAFGPYADSSFGYAAAGAGDVNGDGYDDIAIGAPDYGNEGFVQVWYGGPQGPRLGAPDWARDGFQVGSHFGQAVAAAGDVNGDGYADLIVGAPADDSVFVGQTRPVDEGRAYLFLGSATGLGDAVWSALGGQANGNLGNSVAGAGDVNGDGFGDVIIGMEGWDQPVGPGFSVIDVGRAYVYHGNAGGLEPVPATTLQGSGNSNFGHVVNTAGDVDGDGYSDVIVGAVYADGQGKVAVHRGSAGGIATTAHWTFTSSQANSACGSSVAPAGDVNGDGLSDVVVGSVFGDTGGLVDNGRVWVFAGPLTGSAATTPLKEWSGSQSYENIGHVVAGLGDVNGDGFADVGSGAPGWTGSVYKEGRTVLWYSNNKYQGYDAMPFRAKQMRSDGTAPIGLGGKSTDFDFVLQAWSGSAAGRTDVRLEWQVAPFGTALDGNVEAGPWTDSMPGGPLSTVVMQSPPIPLPGAGLAHWKLRVGSRSPYFPHSVWLSPSRNGRQEADLRRAEFISGVEGDIASAGVPALLSAAPNPFNPRTRLSFELDRAGQLRIELYDLAGRRVATLLDEARPAGRVEVTWDGRDSSGRGVASGTYFARATTGGRTATAKLTLVR